MRNGRCEIKLKTCKDQLRTRGRQRHTVCEEDFSKEELRSGP